MTYFAESHYVEEGKTSPETLQICTVEVMKPEIIEISQIEQSEIKKFTRKTPKLYQNNLTQLTMVYLAKLYTWWLSQYNTVRMTILGEK